MNKWGSEKNASSIDREGLNHAGQQTFAQDSIRGFVREMLQNSLDAKRDSDIVEISSNYTQLNKTDFPDFEGLKKIFLLVEKYFKKENDIPNTSVYVQTTPLLIKSRSDRPYGGAITATSIQNASLSGM